MKGKDTTFLHGLMARLRSPHFRSKRPSAIAEDHAILNRVRELLEVTPAVLVEMPPPKRPSECETRDRYWERTGT